MEAPPSADATYKVQKEAFVSGLSGGSVLSINTVSLTAATTYLLWAVLKTRAPRRRSRRRRSPGKHTNINIGNIASCTNDPQQRSQSTLKAEDPREEVAWLAALKGLMDEDNVQGLTSRLVQFILLVLPLLLVTTVLAQYALSFNILIGSTSLWLLYTFPSLLDQDIWSSSPDQGSAKGDAKKDWRTKSFVSSDEEDGERINEQLPEGRARAPASYSQMRPSLQLHRPSPRADQGHIKGQRPYYQPESYLGVGGGVGASMLHMSAPGSGPSQAVSPSSSNGASPASPATPSPLSPISPFLPFFPTTPTYEGAYDGYVVPHGTPGQHQQQLPFRVSIDSAADAAYAAAHPPSTYRGPDHDGDGGHSHSRSTSSSARTVGRDRGMLRKLFISGGNSVGSTALEGKRGSGRSSYDWSRRGDSIDSQSGGARDRLSLLGARSSLDSAASSSESLTYDDVINGFKANRSVASGEVAGGCLGPDAPLRAASAEEVWYKAAKRKEFLTIYRAHMMLMTVICILAVDFKVFPREFAKCESWGTSLMDLGVGSFVFSLGIVSSGPLIPSLHSARHRFRPPRALLLNNIKKALPLLALGLVRVVMVKGMDYPEHASEYGVHWNFFLTLAVLPVLSSLCRPLTRLARYSVIGLSIGAGYQVLLWWRADLQEWILSDPRVRHGGFVQQNKEGLASLAGYLAIFMLGIDLGHYVLPLDPYQAFRRRSRTRRREKTGKLSMVLASFSVLYWSAFLLLRLLGAQNSRRLANLVYVVWVTAFNASFLLCYVAVYAKWLQLLKQRALASAASVQELEVRQWTKRMAEWSPSLLEDINRHSFAIFLAANMLTGLVNVSMATMHASILASMLVLLLYIGINCVLGSALTRLGWRLPF